MTPFGTEVASFWMETTKHGETRNNQGQGVRAAQTCSTKGAEKWGQAKLNKV